MRVSVALLSAALGLAACKPEGAPPPAKPAPSQPVAPATQPAAGPAKTTTTAAADEWSGGVLRRGAALTTPAVTDLAAVLKSPGDFAGKTVKTEGKVARACSKKGCWMELTTPAGDGGMRVTFKDYAFFVPLDSAGATATIEGTVEVKILSKDDAEHLEGEGARIARNAKGEPQELAFVATGVELHR